MAARALPQLAHACARRCPCSTQAAPTAPEGEAPSESLRAFKRAPTALGGEAPSEGLRSLRL